MRKAKGLILHLTPDGRWYVSEEVKIVSVAENWMKVKRYWWSFPRWLPQEGMNMRVIESIKSNRETCLATYPIINPEAKIGFDVK